MNVERMNGEGLRKEKLMGCKAMAGVRKISGKVKNEVKDNRPIMFV